MHLNCWLLWSFGIVAHSDMFQTIDLAIIELSVLQAQPLQHANEIDIIIDGFYEEGCNLMKMITQDKSRHDICKKKNSTNILHNLQTTKRANCTVGNCRRSDDLIHVKR